MPQIKHRLVGTVRYQVRADKTIQLLDHWAAENIVSVHIPCLKGVDVGGGKKFSGNMSWYKGAVYQLKGAFAEVEAKGLKPKILTYAGSFYPRLIRGATHTPSEHTFGTAFDVNVAWNGLGRTPAPKGAKGSVVELVPIFEKWGFRWGGYFRRGDGMHFEVAQIIKPPSLAEIAPVKPMGASIPPSEIKYILNGKEIEGATLSNGRLSAPLREVVEALGYTIEKTTDKRAATGRYYVRAGIKAKGK